LTPSFSIDGNGHLYAQNATITGDIVASTLTASYGSIAGWQLMNTGLYYGTPGADNYFALETAPASSTMALRNRATSNAITIGNNFSVSSTGTMTS
jgi:hypothetical protein